MRHLSLLPFRAGPSKRPWKPHVKSKNSTCLQLQRWDCRPSLGSLFPITPTDAGGHLQQLSSQLENKETGYNSDLNQGVRELDRSTLFVGGLETFGPSAWDEEKVTKFFARFGGLESVKVVRPGEAYFWSESPSLLSI